MPLQYSGGGYRNIELIAIDDGSNDGTRSILDAVAKNDSRVVAIHQENQGPAAARQTGLRMASGEYVAWCDSDDWWDLDFLETHMRFMKKHNADITICRAKIPGRLDEYDSSLILEWNRFDAIDAFLDHKLLNGVLWDKLIKRDLFEGIAFDKTLWLWEDLDVVWHLLQKSDKVVRFEKATYNFTLHEGSLCASSYSDRRAYASLKVWDRIVADCRYNEGLSKYLVDAEKKRYEWLIGDLCLMFRDGYDEKKWLTAFQKEIRNAGLGGLRAADSLKTKGIAAISIVSLFAAKSLYKFVSSRG